MAPPRSPGTWEKAWDWPFEMYVNREVWDNLIDVDKAWAGISDVVGRNVTVHWENIDVFKPLRDVTATIGRNIDVNWGLLDEVEARIEEILKAVEPYQLNLDDPRSDWTRFMKEWEALLKKLEKKIADLRNGTRNSVAQRLLTVAENIVADVRALAQEASVVPIAILDDLDVWRGKWSVGAQEVTVVVPGIQADTTWIQDRTTLRAIDSEMEAQGLAARKPWKGRVREAYVGAIPGQNAAVGNVVRLADQTVIALGATLLAAGTRYAAWALLLYQVLVLLARFTILDMKVLIDSGEYATLTRLWLSTKAADVAAATSMKVQDDKLTAFLAGRPGLTQPDQLSPNSGGRVDRNWPNPFNNVNFLRADVVKGKIRLEGGAKLDINRRS
jgi:predicted DNA-binding antitoxin AbrB/MazE fold protein